MAEDSETFVPQIRLTYTKDDRFDPPEQGAVIRFEGLSRHGRLFRVVNEPEPDEHGTFTVEVEQVPRG